jgi:predicted RNA-binding Zn-ribbon protein involved in translation (DUF1610 family)
LSCPRETTYVTSDTTSVGEETVSAGEETTHADGETEDTSRGRPCPQCGAAMVHRHCEYVCPNHGVVMDCSDTFYS